MLPRSDTVFDEYEIPVQGALVYVYNEDGTEATLTSDGTSPLVQPITTDEFGIYSYYADPGRYTEDFWYGGKRRFRQAGVLVGDGGGGTAITLAELAPIASGTILGNNNLSSGSPAALTVAQAAAMFSAFTGDTGAGGVKGMVPAPVAGDAAASKFLSASGTWQVPTIPGGAGTTSNVLTFDNSGTGAASGSTFNGSAAKTISWNTLGAAKSGALTASGVTISTGKLAGRTTASTGAVEEITPDATLALAAGAVGVAKVPNAVTFNITGGVAAGTAFDGSVTRIVDWSSVGALPIVPRVQSVISAATITPTANDDMVIVTALAVDTTLANISGTLAEGQGFVVRIKDNGTSRAIAYGTKYRDVGPTRQTATVPGKVLYLGIIYNAVADKLDIVSVSQEA